MWNNDGWARTHLKKRHPEVSIEEAWEVVFVLGGVILVSPDQLRYPPFRRYWMIGTTKSEKLLLVVWEQWRGIKNLITAYPPNKEQVRTYETKIKRSQY